MNKRRLTSGKSNESAVKKKSVRQNKSRRASNSDDEQMDVDFSQEEEHENEELNEKVKRIIRFILNKSDQKGPIKRGDIVKHCLPGVKRGFQSIFKPVCKTLLEDYGLQIELVSTNGEFMIINKCPIDAREEDERGEVPEDKEKVLIFLILTHVFMSNGHATMEDLHGFLRNLGIEKTSGLFGDVHEFIEKKMMQMHYLTSAIPDNATELRLQWGERAELEISKLDVLNFVSKMYPGFSPETWKELYPLAEKQAQTLNVSATNEENEQVSN